MARSSSNRKLGQRPGQLGLADAGRAEEEERADRAVGVLEAGAGAAHRGGDRARPPRPGRPRGCAAAPPCAAACPSRPPGAWRPGSRSSGRPRSAIASSVTSSASSEPCSCWWALRRRRGLLELPVQPRQLAVAELGGALEVAVALGPLGGLAGAPRSPPWRCGCGRSAPSPRCHDAFRPAMRSLRLASSPSISARRCPGGRRPRSLASARFSISRRSAVRSSVSISVGSESISMRSCDAASSTRSIALSGRKRSVM